MHIEKLSLQQEDSTSSSTHRPTHFDEFIGQTHIIPVIETAINSAQKQ